MKNKTHLPSISELLREYSAPYQEELALLKKLEISAKEPLKSHLTSTK